MYLGARLFGIFTYLVVLVVFLWLLRQCPRRRTRSVLIAFAVVLVVIAFLYDPAPESDLFRLRIYSQDFARFTWPEFFSAMWHRSVGFSSTPLSALLMRLSGLSGIPGLLSASICAIVFAVVFYLLWRSYMDRCCSNAALAMCLLWFLSADFFMPVIATLRSYLAAALVALCVAREAHRGRTGPVEVVLYVMALLAHSIGIALVGIRCAAYLLQPNVTNRRRILCLLAMAAGAVLSYGLYDDILAHSFEKFLSYTTDPEAYSYVWERVILFLVMAGEYRCWWVLRGSFSVRSPRLAPFYAVFRLSLVVQTVLCFQFAIFQRMSFFTVLMALPLVMEYCRTVSGRHRWTINFYSVSSVLLLVLTCARGYLCSLKFW